MYMIRTLATASVAVQPTASAASGASLTWQPSRPTCWMLTKGRRASGWGWTLAGELPQPDVLEGNP